MILDRETALTNHKTQMEEVYEKLLSTKFSRIINKIGFYIKRWFFLLFGIAAIVLALGLFFFPDFFYGEEAKEDFVMKYRSDFYQHTGDVFEQAIANGSKSNIQGVTNQRSAFGIKLDNSLQETVSLEIALQFKMMAVISFVLGLFSLYISSLTKHIFARNEKLIAVEKVVHAAVKDYDEAIQFHQKIKEALIKESSSDHLLKEQQ